LEPVLITKKSRYPTKKLFFLQHRSGGSVRNYNYYSAPPLIGGYGYGMPYGYGGGGLLLGGPSVLVGGGGFFNLIFFMFVASAVVSAFRNASRGGGGGSRDDEDDDF
jgi:uncharacterized membrane protein